MTDDGRLILWNSFTGSMSVFPADRVEQVVALLRQRGFRAPEKGLVGYLRDRGYLVRRGTDEFRRVQYAFGQEQYRTDRLELILLASEDCNFRCTYCYEKFARGTMQPDVRAAVKKLVRSRLPQIRHLQISWFGGEPLYGYEAIEELAPFFTEVAEESSLGFFSHMTTNGYLLDREMADRLLEWKITDFQITVDGTPEDHDVHRPTRDGEGTFDRIFHNLCELSRRSDDFSVQLRVNFDRDNCTSLERFLDLVQRDLGDDPRFTVSFHAVGRWGGPNDEDLAVCGHEEAAAVKAQLKHEARSRGLEVGGGLTEIRGPGAQVCYAARPYNFIIGADGTVMKCTIAMDTEDYNVVGRLLESGEIELDEDKMALWTEPAFEGDTKCRKCVIMPTCQGIHCPKIRIEENRTPCPDTRLNLKQEMREALAFKEGDAHLVKVSGTAAG